MRRQGSFEKIIMLGKIHEGSRKRERSNMRWVDSIKEAESMNLQELSRAAENRALWTSLIPGVKQTLSGT